MDELVAFVDELGVGGEGERDEGGFEGAGVGELLHFHVELAFSRCT